MLWSYEENPLLLWPILNSHGSSPVTMHFSILVRTHLLIQLDMPFKLPLKTRNFYLATAWFSIVWALNTEPLPFTISTNPSDPNACPPHGNQINVTRPFMLERKSQVSFNLTSQRISYFASDTTAWSLRIWYTKTDRQHVRFLTLTCWYLHAHQSFRKTVACQ